MIHLAKNDLEREGLGLTQQTDFSFKKVDESWHDYVSFKRDFSLNSSCYLNFLGRCEKSIH